MDHHETNHENITPESTNETPTGSLVTSKNPGLTITLNPQTLLLALVVVLLVASGAQTAQLFALKKALAVDGAQTQSAGPPPATTPPTPSAGNNLPNMVGGC
ncbi:hypothetical protein HY628_02210 [Candidatus Uhrbacteria bacterium]|nr:hypothetical protein [Candidatus Uhrbacteria bacterium]